MKLTEEILSHLGCDTSKGFLYFGVINNCDIYRVIRTGGGKRGNPKYFAVDNMGNIEWIKGLENINIIHIINPTPQLVSPELVYQDL